MHHLYSNSDFIKVTPAKNLTSKLWTIWVIKFKSKENGVLTWLLWLFFLFICNMTIMFDFLLSLIWGDLFKIDLFKISFLTAIFLFSLNISLLISFLECYKWKVVHHQCFVPGFWTLEEAYVGFLSVAMYAFTNTVCYQSCRLIAHPFRMTQKVVHTYCRITNSL